MEPRIYGAAKNKWHRLVDKLYSFDRGYYRCKEANFIPYKIVEVGFDDLDERDQHYFADECGVDLDYLEEERGELPDFARIECVDNDKASEVDFIVMEYWAQEADGDELLDGLRDAGIAIDPDAEVQKKRAYIFERRDAMGDETVFDDDDVKKVIQKALKGKGWANRDLILLITDWCNPEGFINVVGDPANKEPTVSYEPFSYIPC